MPHIDGVEAAQAIKALYAGVPGERRTCPPIVALTANAFPEDRARYVAAGMDDYLSKPFDRAALDAVMVRWLARSPATSQRAGTGWRAGSRSRPAEPTPPYAPAPRAASRNRHKSC